jgi:C_GCAxxG_C_C family probable redox protein
MAENVLFSNGYNCCQAVAAPFAAQFGLSDDLIFKIGSAFGGGMGRRGHVCGAVSGALMVIGLRYSNFDPADRAAKKFVNEQAQKFMDRFNAAHGSIYCRDLIGRDFALLGEYELAHKEKRFDRFCDDYVSKAIALLSDQLKEA